MIVFCGCLGNLNTASTQKTEEKRKGREIEKTSRVEKKFVALSD